MAELDRQAESLRCRSKSKEGHPFSNGLTDPGSAPRNQSCYWFVMSRMFWLPESDITRNRNSQFCHLPPQAIDSEYSSVNFFVRFEE
jgi:hypothetical protein